ncbi:MAG TPA: DnaJ domain-containing protein [Candidatus Omnitrophota bacterium]|nr:DnaJ domain-containing protein [Candidatus Omnitrophota bacterium]
MKYSKDYYKILGVSESASADQIKKDYRKLAIQYHPDKNKGNKQAEEKFKEISEAYYVLSDPKRRAEFDQFRKFGGVDPRGGGGFHGAEGFDFEDLLRSYGRQGRGASNRSQSYSGFADIFEELFSGGGMNAQFDYGSQGRRAGRQQPAEAENYDDQGTLKVSAVRAKEGGAVKIRSKDGKIIAVKIPKDARDGMKLRLKGLGKLLLSGKKSDLILRIKVVA